MPLRLPRRLPCCLLFRPPCRLSAFLTFGLLGGTFAAAPVLAGTPASTEREGAEALAVHWKGSTVSIADLPPELGRPIAASFEKWAPWCERAEYEVYVEDGGRVALVCKQEGRAAERMLAKLQATLAAFDRLLPARLADPDETFLEADWGASEIVPDRDPVVLFELDGVDHLSSLLERVREAAPELSSWSRSQEGKSGFMHSHALCAAWLSAPPDLELGTVWRPQNELVNRLARMLLLRRFGRQPRWIEMGVAWRLEQQVMGDIYAFPDREDFVGIGEHGGWRNELKSAFKKRKKQPLELAEFGKWRSGRWDMPAAQIAWGLVRFLAEEHPEALPLIAEDLRRDAKAGARVVREDGTWELRPTYETPLETQRTILTTHAGEDVLQRAGEWFAR